MQQNVHSFGLPSSRNKWQNVWSFGQGDEQLAVSAFQVYFACCDLLVKNMLELMWQLIHPAVQVCMTVQKWRRLRRSLWALVSAVSPLHLRCRCMENHVSTVYATRSSSFIVWCWTGRVAVKNPPPTHTHTPHALMQVCPTCSPQVTCIIFFLADVKIFLSFVTYKH